MVFQREEIIKKTTQTLLYVVDFEVIEKSIKKICCAVLHMRSIFKVSPKIEHFPKKRGKPSKN